MSEWDFVLGFSVIFVLMGAGATVLGRMLLYYRYEANLVGGALVVLFGVFMTGQMTAFAYWLLDVFPVLGRIG